MDISYQILISLGCLAVLIWTIYFLLPNKEKKRGIPYDATETSGDSNTNTSPDTDSARSKSAPAPAARSYSRGWVWWIPVLLALAGLGWWAYTNLKLPPGTGTSATSTSPPDAPKKMPSLQVGIEPVKVIAGKSFGVIVKQKDRAGNPTEFTVRSGGKALMIAEMYNLPRQGTIHLRAFITRDYAGKMFLAINGKGYESLHKGAGRQWTVFSIPVSDFHNGRNSVVLSSPGEDIVVLSPNIEIE